MSAQKREFINNEILTSSIVAGLGRGYSVYSNKKVLEKNRNELKRYLRGKLVVYSKKYSKKITSEDHFKSIEKFANGVTKDYKNILNDGYFMIGRAQKLLNLYLKFQWVLGWIPEPPHCPLDYRIIKKLDSNISWTKMNEINEYQFLVEKAEREAKKQNLSLAKWELQLWNSLTFNQGKF